MHLKKSIVALMVASFLALSAGTAFGGNILLLDLGQVGDKEYKIKLSLSNIPKLFMRKNSSKNICKTPLVTLVGVSFHATLKEFLDCVYEEVADATPDLATISDILIKEGVL